MVDYRPPLPPFTPETATSKVRLAKNDLHTRDPERMATADTEDSCWRNRAEFVDGRTAIIAFPARKWIKDLDYSLIKELLAFTDQQIADQSAYEWHYGPRNFFWSYGNENWEFVEAGRFACVNVLPIGSAERKFFWNSSDPRPPEHAGRSELCL